jgi:WD40 repeat protein
MPNGDAVRGLAFDPTGSRLVSGSEDGHARVWDLKSGQGSAVLDASYTYETDWSASNNRLAVVAQDYRHFYVDVVDADSPDDPVRLEQPAAAVAQFSSDGQRVVTGGNDGSAAIWNAETGSMMVNLPDQESAVTSASFVPGDMRVVTSSQGGTDVLSAASGLQLTSIDEPAADAVAGNDGQLVIARSDMNAVEVHECEVCDADADQLLELARSRITRELTPQEATLYGID